MPWWIYVLAFVFSVLTQAVIGTIFMYREFATKKDLSIEVMHLKDLMQKDQQVIATTVANIHQSIGEIKQALKEQRDEIITKLNGGLNG